MALDLVLPVLLQASSFQATLNAVKYLDMELRPLLLNYITPAVQKLFFGVENSSWSSNEPNAVPTLL